MSSMGSSISTCACQLVMLLGKVIWNLWEVEIFWETYIIWSGIWWLLALIHFFLSLSVLCIVDEMWSASFQSLTPLFPCLLSCLLQGDEFYLFRNFRLFSAYSLFSFRIIIYGSKTLVNNSYDLDQVHVTNTIKSSSPKPKQNKKNQLKTVFERWPKEIHFWKKT